MEPIRWQCQCGKSGWMIPEHFSLAGMVRQARRIHKCPDPDIEYLETKQEHYLRTHPLRHYHPGTIW